MTTTGRRVAAPAVPVARLVAAIVLELVVVWLAFHGLTDLWWSGDLRVLYYFSNLSALVSLVLGVWSLVGSIRPRRPAPSLLFVIALVSEVLTAVVSHTLIPQGPPTRALTWGLDYTGIVHAALPVAVVVLYAVAPRARVSGRGAVIAALWPMAYLVVVLLAAPSVGGVPYAFLNVPERGLGQVLAAVLGAVTVAAATAAGAWLADRRRTSGRR